MIGRVTFLLVLCATAMPAAVQTPVTARAIDEAISLGKSTIEGQRITYHRPYRLIVSRSPVDYIEVITPFRRLVIAAEERARLGDRSFGQRQALELLSTVGEELEVRIELTFHPLNTYVAVPAYTVTLAGPGPARIDPRTFELIPRYGARVDGPSSATPTPTGPVLPGASQPILGGTVVAHFDLRLLNPTALYDVVCAEGGKELTRARMDLARLR